MDQRRNRPSPSVGFVSPMQALISALATSDSLGYQPPAPRPWADLMRALKPVNPKRAKQKAQRQARKAQRQARKAQRK